MTSTSPTFLARFAKLLRPVFHGEMRGRLFALLAGVLALKTRDRRAERP